MPARIALALAQMNPTVGDIDGNLTLIRRARAKAAARGADLVVFPELMLVGYPPEDLVLKPALAEEARRAVDGLALETADGGPGMIVGTPWRERDGRLFNTAVLLHRGRLAGRVAKHVLPNYGVFDEKRVFETGAAPGPLAFSLPDGEAIRLGVMLGEDMWVQDVAEGLGESGAEILVVPCGSPFEVGKQDVRLQLAVARVTETGLPLALVNQVGGQDELVFDGASFALDADRRLVAQAPAFTDHLLMTTWERGPDDVWVAARAALKVAPLEPIEAVYRALVVGLRDYVEKNRFPGVVMGLSGSVDAALSAAVAVDALGTGRVRGLIMASRHTDVDSLADAAICAANLKIQLDQVGIEPAIEAFGAMLAPVLANSPSELADKDLHSRLRGVILMAVSDRLGPMLLTTGNKSELSTGRATLYGDMCGGYSILKDVYKTSVIELSRWRNTQRPNDVRGPVGIVVPERIIARSSMAGSRAGQHDDDTSPDHEALDRVLRGLVEADRSPGELVDAGEAPELVHRVQDLLDLAEYKRRQAPPGVKITNKAFGRDRRYPITNAFRRLGSGQIGGD